MYTSLSLSTYTSIYNHGYVYNKQLNISRFLVRGPAARGSPPERGDWCSRGGGVYTYIYICVYT